MKLLACGQHVMVSEAVVRSQWSTGLIQQKGSGGVNKSGFTSGDLARLSSSCLHRWSCDLCVIFHISQSCNETWAHQHDTRLRKSFTLMMGVLLSNVMSEPRSDRLRVRTEPIWDLVMVQGDLHFLSM